MPTATTRNDYVLALIEDIVKQTDHHTTIVICSSRSDFFEQLIQCINTPPISIDTERQPEIPSSQDSDQELDPISVPSPLEHPLLSPTLHLLAVSERVQLAFCPNIPTLRAYLSVFPTASSNQTNTLSRRLIIVNLLALHHGTSDFTIQGMSRTLSLVASVAHQTQMDVQVTECKDAFDPTNPNRGFSLWDTQVRLLSGSIKLSEGGAKWAGQTIALRKVAARWFRFE